MVSGAIPLGRRALRSSRIAFEPATGMPAGIHPSKCVRVRSSPGSLHRPDSNGGRGRCFGLGSMIDGGIEKNGPSCSTGSSPQQASRAGMKSSSRRPRVAMSVPDASCCFAGPSDAEADVEPPAREDVDRRQATGQLSRPVMAGDEDRRPDAHGAGPRRHGREQLERGERALELRRDRRARASVVATLRREGPEEVIAHPQAAVAELLGLLAEATQQLDVEPWTELRQAQADPGLVRHGSYPTDAHRGGAMLHFADIFEAIADAVPDAPAISQGRRVVRWGEYDDGAARLAAALADHGLGHGSKVGMFMYNSPEYLVTQYAAFKERMTPINVNYRYLDDELTYLLDNADCEAVVYHRSLERPPRPHQGSAAAAAVVRRRR